jgi:hypothetical protein
MRAGYVNKPYGFSSGKKICWGASKNIMNREWGNVVVNNNIETNVDHVSRFEN